MARHTQTSDIRTLIVHSLKNHPKDIVGVITSTYGISRQAANRHLKEMCDEGLLAATGKTRSRQYTLRETVIIDELIPLKGLQEDIPWSQKVSPHLTGLKQNVFRILNYGFTEMLNNAIDHSNSASVGIRVSRTVQFVEMRVIDFGIGIFTKIKDSLGLEDEFQGICHLATGKFTTDPSRHSGEGIFFTSRMFDQFSILSGSIFFAHSKPEEGQPDKDWLVEDRTDTSPQKGTFVRMFLDVSSTTEYDVVFNTFAGENNDYKFSKTHVPVTLLQYGQDNLVSRSQAKRLLTRFDVFEEVLLDFAGIEFVGQGFADEVFRVYQMQHPNVRIVHMNASPSVLGMINHAISNRAMDEAAANSGLHVPVGQFKQ